MDPSLPRPLPRPSLGERLRDWVIWFGPWRLVATASAVVAVVLGGIWLLKGSPPRTEDSLPFATRPPTATSPAGGSTTSVLGDDPAVVTTAPAAIVVYVTGEVAVPGVYTLASPARVNDALLAAGGAGANADLAVVNLAAPIHDGERVYVPAVGATIPPAIELTPNAPGTTPAGPVNINTASVDQLDELPGVGPTTAAAIVAHRQQQGPFQTVEQLADVRGIGPAKLELLRGLVTV